MSVSVAAPTRVSTQVSVGLPRVYAGALAFWLVTRWLVLVHQGAWPWMNAFVVAAARGMVVGDWNDAVRPQLPAVLGVPLVLAGASEQQTVAVLYVVASLVQFGAFVVLVRALYPARVEEQTLGLLLFLLVPFNHSIHHYRDMPVVLASSAVFLLAAHFIRAARSYHRAAPAEGSPRAEAAGTLNPGRPTGGLWFLFSPSARAFEEADRAKQGGDAPPGSEAVRAGSGEWPEDGLARPAARDWRGGVWVVGAMLLGVWSRTEVLTFVGVLIVLALLLWRRQALRVAITYAVAALVVSGSLLMVFRLEGVDLSEASLYQAHTFLDSTPESWLSADCRANATENCREADGLTYFGPADLHAGVLPLIVNHPLTTVAKTLQSAWDNLWIIFGPNLSTFPGTVPFLLLALGVARPARDLLKRVPAAVWIAVVAVLAETVLPPLSWAPPHPQYHLQLVFPIVALGVPILLGLARLPRGQLLALAFLVGNAGLSAFRYTRFPGY